MPARLGSIISGRAESAFWMYWSITGIVGILAILFFRRLFSSSPPIMAVAPTLKYISVPAATRHTATVFFVHVSVFCALRNRCQEEGPLTARVIASSYKFHDL